MPSINLIVFRDTWKEVSGKDLCSQMRKAVVQCLRTKADNDDIDPLLLAGEIECALSDLDFPNSGVAERITNWWAQRIIGAQANDLEIQRWLDDLDKSVMPSHVRISSPEGFAYYALHPADFADATLTYSNGARVAVIGIRSIGTVLSAVAMAGLIRRGISAERITVRPEGHPYDRTLRISNAQRSWIEEHKGADSHFLIVDEGPGLSGSSFLATAEAVQGCGVNPNQITLVGTRDVDRQQLCARDAAKRWERFAWRRVPSRICREFEGLTSLAGGTWRNALLEKDVEWPPCWPEMERLKFLSPDREFLLKFDGFGESGAQARERARAVYKAGFGPACENQTNGMSVYRFVNGRPLSRSDCSSAVLERVVAYCAFRASEFKVCSRYQKCLEQMIRFNFSQEFGWDLELPADCLQTEDAVVVDGRMHPHEWVAANDGTIQKVDTATHGDDHFMPGPTDIAWDLAGAVVEWSLDQGGEEFLLNRFRSRTGLDLSERFQYFLHAYAVFRMSYCKMAASATQSENDKHRLERAYKSYRRRISEAFSRLRRQPL